jgi:quinol monooxygenase YgiN
MPRCCLIVTFDLKPGAWPAFNAIISEHAARTLAEEPGCSQFDVLHPELEGGHVDESRLMLVEMYDDAAALAAHRAGPRMPHVGAAIGPLMTRQTVIACTVD